MKFGISRVNITPGHRTCMAGYAFRDDLSDGVNDPLTFTSLIIEEKGRKVFIGAVDLVGIDCAHSKKIRLEIARILNINLSDVMINYSHTHGGMRVDPNDIDYRRLMPVINKNRKLLERKIFASVNEAAANMREGRMFYGEGKTSIPMNRRLLHKGKVENRPNPEGKIDNSLKVLKITDADGRIAAIIARVSCHPVATDAQHLITADFPGAFRDVFEKYFPGALAVFWQGVGGDARPAHVASQGKWIMMPHCDLHIIGECLFREILGVLVNNMIPIKNINLKAGIKEVELPLMDCNVKREDLEKMLEAAEKNNSYTVLSLKKMLSQKKLATGLPVIVQMISFNRQFSMAGIAGEVLCGLGEILERGVSTEYKMLNGYTNCSSLYLLDKKEFKRGGYESETYIYKQLPSPLSPSLETVLKSAISELDKRLNKS